MKQDQNSPPLTKTIDTLIPDIYHLFDEDTEVVVTSDEAQELGLRIASHLKDQLTRVSEGAKLRMSNFGRKCKRQLWYDINHPELAEKLPAYAKIKFFFGHLIEEVVLWLAAKAGHKVEGMQDEVHLESLTGHRDGIIDGVLVDVKSASSRSFSKFSDGLTPDDDNFGYLDQLDAYLEASQGDEKLLDKSKGAFLVVDKQLGKIHLDKHPRLNVDYKKKIDDVRRIVGAKEPPQRYYDDIPEGKSGNRKIPTPCQYCQFKWECWKDSNNGRGLRSFNYSTGPVWLTNVAREPRVDEA